MWDNLANFKENLSQIALDVQDAADELDVYGSPVTTGEDASVSDRRASHRFAHSKSPVRASIPNRIGSPLQPDIERYKAQIQRLQSSEAEVKALSVNYAAILKEKEDELLRLHEENILLKKNLDARAVSNGSRNESPKMSLSSSNSFKGTSEQTSNKHQRHTAKGSSRSFGNHSHKATTDKHDVSRNGTLHATNFDGDEKEPTNIFEEQKYVSELRKLQTQLDKEHENLASMTLQLQGAQKLNEVSQKELQTLKVDNDRMSAQMQDVQKELSEKNLEVIRLQSELIRRDSEESNVSVESLKSLVASLEKENANLEAEKSELVTLKHKQEHRMDKSAHLSDEMDIHASELVLKLEKALKDVSHEKDKAMQELSRLKQHLLDKELEESEKMDEDSKVIEDLRAKCEYQRSQILHMEKALKQTISNQEEAKMINSDELRQANEMISDLKRQLSGYMSTVDAKNNELLNLQTVLGQYYAETEAKERLGRDLAVARDELNKLSELLKEARHRQEMEKKEKEEISSNLSQAERIFAESKLRMQKLEDDNQRLRRALEQSMTSLNRMSVDSDYLVDRRIVIKLLVTYFQRNHSKEVLDLMVRMLGFSEEDKHRIGFAQQTAGRGVVRGVLGLPGRLVGGILGGGSSQETHGHVPVDNQSFADMWVDFLLKETEEREKRESAEAAAAALESASASVSVSTRMSPVSEQRLPQTATSSSSTAFQLANDTSNHIQSPVSGRGIRHQSLESDSEFLTVPLTSTSSAYLENSSRFSRSPLR